MANVKTFTRQIDSTTWLILGLMMLPGFAHAAGGDPINQGLQWLIDLLTSGMGRTSPSP